MNKVKKNTKANMSDSQIEIMKSIPHLSFSKATMRQVQIIEAAIFCYANFGINDTTFERIAKQAKLSRPLIFHYFNDKNEIYEAAIKYVRAVYQQLVIEGINKAKTGKEKFEFYLEACYDWLVRHPYHIKLWLLFYHSASTLDKYRDMNSEFVSIGIERIAALIRGIEGNENMTLNTSLHKARMVQAMITGGVVQSSTENSEILPKDYVKSIAKTCMDLAVKN